MRFGAVLSSPVTGMNDSRDTLYTRPMAEPAAFTFDDEVARVFPDMIRRSVPPASLPSRSIHGRWETTLVSC